MPPILCHYTISKEYFNSVTTNSTVESTHFAIYLRINDNYFKVQLENNIYLPDSYTEDSTEMQPLERIHNQRAKQTQQNQNFTETYPIVQHTDATLNTIKTDPFTTASQNLNYAELIKSIKFSFPVTDDFIPKPPEIYNYFHTQKTEKKKQWNATRPSSKTDFSLEKVHKSPCYPQLNI